MNLATTKNLTILGIVQILQAAAVLAETIFDGNPATNPDWGVFVTAVIAGVGLIIAKGAGTTGVQTIGGKPAA